jgi:phosphatidylglycerophosphate synthase
VINKTPELRGADLLNWPGLLTGIRLGIAIGFPFLIHSPRLALGAYVVALLTDVFDGRLARALNQQTQAGAIADGWVDKILHVNAGWAMWIHGYMPGVFLILLFTRELIQFPQVLWLAGPFWRGEVCAQEAFLSGKLTSIFQAIAFLAIFLGWMTVGWIAASLTGLTGTWAALNYVSREQAQGVGRAS